MIAASKGDAEMVALLLKHKAEPNLADSRNNTALWNAINARSAKTVRACSPAEQTPTPPVRWLARLDDGSGDARDSEMVAALIEAKANVKTTDAVPRPPALRGHGQSQGSGRTAARRRRGRKCARSSRQDAAGLHEAKARFN